MPSTFSLSLLFCLLLCVASFCIAQDANRCVNTQDHNSFVHIRQLYDQDPIHNPDFKGIFNQCMKDQLIPSAGYVSYCCQQKMGISQACSSCMGDAVNCVLANCKLACAFQGQDACQACFVQYCNANFETCIGYDAENPY